MPGLTNYTHYLHGEAVSIGMLMAFSLSVKKNLIPESSLYSATELLNKLRLPIKSELAFDINDFLEVMSKDKKNKTDSLRLILLNQNGPVIIDENDRQLIASVIAEYTA